MGKKSKFLDKDIHRYFALMFVIFVLSQELLIDGDGNLIDFRFFCAVVIVVATPFLLGNRNAMLSCCINVGFLLSMCFFGKKDLIFLFSSPWKENFFSQHCVLTSFCLLTLIVSLIIFFRFNHVSHQKDKINRDFLFPERKETFNAFSEYISSHSVVGVDSPYGNGKTTFVDILKNEKEREDWCFITIGILSTTVDNVEYCIIREIERALGGHGSFSSPINKIKSFFSHDFAFCIGDLLFESRSYEDKIKDFVEDIHRLKKTIVLNFEDIDRISEVEHLNKIFSICDALLTVESKNGFEDGRFIKVIYQCNIESLKKLFKKTYDDERYIEKYIKQTYSIPKLADSFFKKVLNENPQKYDKIVNNDFSFLSRRFVYNTSQGELNLSLTLDNPTVRGVEQILDKINSSCRLYAENQDNDFEAVVIFNIIMYFFPHIYHRLSKKENLDEQKLFYYVDPNTGDDKKLSLSELRDYKRNTGTINGEPVEKIFYEEFESRANENRDTLVLLCLLGYEGWFYGYEGIKTNKIVLKLLGLH